MGKWRDGRIGEVRGLRPDLDYGALVFQPKVVVTSPPNAEENYRPLVIEIVHFFETKNPPVPNTETLETIEFMDAATQSMKSNGAPVRLR